MTQNTPISASTWCTCFWQIRLNIFLKLWKSLDIEYSQLKEKCFWVLVIFHFNAKICTYALKNMQIHMYVSTTCFYWTCNKQFLKVLGWSAIVWKKSAIQKPGNAPIFYYIEIWKLLRFSYFWGLKLGPIFIVWK